MRDPKRIERILTLVKQIWVLMPDLRLMQLLENVRLRMNTNADPFFTEDNIMEEGLIQFLKEMEQVNGSRK